MNYTLPRLIFIALLCLAATSAAWGQACSRTSDFMEVACKSEVRENFWIEYSYCRNMTSNRDIYECYLETLENREEGFAECGDVRDSRNSVCTLLGEDPYDPQYEPEDFLSPEDAVATPNNFFPIIPGTTMVYHVTEGDEEITEIITLTFTDRTREIDGVECFVVNDIVTTPDGEVIEDTDDYYAVDRDLNVWYFGEISKSFEDGFLTDLEGSFIAGEEGAKPGIIMLANPQVDDVYRQEFSLGDAEDYAVILSLTGDESTAIADCEGACLVSNDLVATEPEADESKFYKAGLGVIVEVDNLGDERVELVQINLP